MITFNLPLTLPSLNVWQRMHWAKRQRYTRDLSWLVWSAVCHLDRSSWPIQRAKVTVTRYGKRDLDTDNLYASVKSLADILKVKGGLGIIQDDDPNHCELVATQCRARGLPGTFVVIEELEPLRAA